jgi:hypothetical protein
VDLQIPLPSEEGGKEADWPRACHKHGSRLPQGQLNISGISHSPVTDRNDSFHPPERYLTLLYVHGKKTWAGTQSLQLSKWLNTLVRSFVLRY